MSDEQFTSEKAYTTSQIADRTGIAEPTVRKYAQALERAGYRFIKDAFGARTYVEKDAMAIQAFKDARTKTNFPVEQVAAAIASKYASETPIQTIAPADTEAAQRYDDLLREQLTPLIDNIVAERVRAEVSALKDVLLERLDERDAVIRELSEALNAQKALAAADEDRTKERDEKLTQVLREIQEVKQAQKQEAEKSIWKRIFGGK